MTRRALNPPEDARLYHLKNSYTFAIALHLMTGLQIIEVRAVRDGYFVSVHAALEKSELEYINSFGVYSLSNLLEEWSATNIRHIDPEELIIESVTNEEGKPSLDVFLLLQEQLKRVESILLNDPEFLQSLGIPWTKMRDIAIPVQLS